MWAVTIMLLLFGRKRAQRERRRGRSPQFVLWTMLSGLAIATAIAVVLAFAVTLWLAGAWYLGVTWIAIAAWSFLPTTIARTVAVPLGWVRVAYLLGTQTRERGGDRRGNGLLLAAWALCRRPSAGAAAWIEAKRDASGRLGDCAIVATALCAAARGDRDGARAMLEGLALMPEITPAAREIATEWLAVDDAERGQWARILARAPRMTHGQLEVDGDALGLPSHVDAVKRGAVRWESVWPATPMTFLLEGIAMRRLGVEGAPAGIALWTRWIEAPRRRQTWELVKEAGEISASTTTTTTTTTTATGDTLARAVAAHAEAMVARTAAPVIAAAAAWDEALASEEMRTSVLSRAIDVGAPADAGHRVLDELARTAADDLAAVILAAALPVGDLRGGKTLDAAILRARHKLLADLELAVSRTAQRVRDRRALPAIDEWREVSALVDAHRRAVRIGGEELRRLAFPHVHGELTPWLVWLWNERGEHALSDALTCWLLAEALAVGDAQAIETHAKNASMGLPPRR